MKWIQLTTAEITTIRMALAVLLAKTKEEPRTEYEQELQDKQRQNIDTVLAKINHCPTWGRKTQTKQIGA